MNYTEFILISGLDLMMISDHFWLDRSPDNTDCEIRRSLESPILSAADLTKNRLGCSILYSKNIAKQNI